MAQPETTFGSQDDTFRSAANTSQFPQLSETPLANPHEGMPMCSPIDKITLQKKTPREEFEGPIEKDVRNFMIDTDKMIKFGIKQAKQQKAIHEELNRLLENEEKILTHLMKRYEKFVQIKNENKAKGEAWEEEHKKKMEEYEQYERKLMDFPGDQILTQARLPGEIHQKLLYTLVYKTSNITNGSMVQISLQNTLANDVEVSLKRLNHHCMEMMTRIAKWKKTLATQKQNQDRIHEQWEKLRVRANELKEHGSEVFQRKANEERFACLMAEEGCNESTMKELLQFIYKRVEALETSINDIRSQSRPTSPGSPGNRMVEGPFPTGEHYFGIPYESRPPTVNAPPSSPVAANYDCDLQITRTRECAGNYPGAEVVDIPGMGYLPRSALDRGGRPRGPVPISPPPQNFGSFYPIAAASPVGVNRPSVFNFPEPPKRHPKSGQPLDPELIDNIRDDVEHMSRRNKKLEEIANNFRKMRAIIADELDKATRLNDKLQRDLAHVSNEATKMHRAAADLVPGGSGGPGGSGNTC